jgi:D-lactate dehydrogenase
MGAQRGDETREALPVVAERLFRKAGFDVVYPAQLGRLCCGQPFDSQGLKEVAESKAKELEGVLAEASDGGRYPIVFDTSPCAYTMKRFVQGRLTVLDSIEFLQERVAPRLEFERKSEPVAIHPVCSVRKMGTVDQLAALAARCSGEVVRMEEVLCCGFAGDKGFNRPELNEHALRHLKEALPAGCHTGYSSSRTCEIGLSEVAGFPFHSIIRLVDACTRATVANGPAEAES